MKKEEIFKNVKQIAYNYGLTINEDDFYLKVKDGALMWFLTPYEACSGVMYEYNNSEGYWWFVNADSYTIRFMENDFDMFDAIGEYLREKEVDNSEEIIHF